MLARVASRASRSAQSYSRSFATVKFTKSHEYVKVDGAIGTVGITSHAASELGDVVFVDLPSVGSKFKAGDSFGSVESVKAASDVYCPVAGEVVEINSLLSETPGTVNESAMEKGWFIKIKLTDANELDTLMSDAEYQTLTA